MKRLLSTIVMCIAVFVAAPAQAQENTKSIYGVELSPDGTSYAVLRQYQGQRVVAIYDVDDPNKPPVAVGLGDFETGSFSWGGPDNILVQMYGEQSGVDTTSGTKTLEFSRWMSISRKDGDMLTLFDNEVGSDYYYLMQSAGTLISTLPGKPERALFARQTVKQRPKSMSRLQDGQDTLVLSLISINLDNNRRNNTETGQDDTIDWVVNVAGDAVARIDANESRTRQEIFTRPDGKGSFRSVAQLDLEDGQYQKVSFLGVSSIPGNLQALVTDQAGKAKLVHFDMNTGSFGGDIYAPASGNVDGVDYDPYAARATVAYVADGNSRYAYHLSENDRSTKVALENALQGAAVVISSKATASERMLVKAFYSDKPTEYYFYDKIGKRLELIASE